MSNKPTNKHEAYSSLHEQTLQAKNTKEQIKNYSKWASTYEQEMYDCDLKSYQSIAESLFEIYPTYKGDNKFTNTTPLSILDAGCGTGLLGEHIINLATVNSVKMTGIDLCQAMIEEAEKKYCFEKLVVESLNNSLPFTNNYFDVIVSAGVFLQGHCEPECISNLLCYLKPDGYMIFTVRKSYFDHLQDNFIKAIEDSKTAQLISYQEKPYYGEIKAYVLIVKKTRQGIDKKEDYTHDYLSKGFCLLPQYHLNTIELNEIKTYLSKRLTQNHPSNIYEDDSLKQLRATHGYEAGMLQTLMPRLASEAKTLITAKTGQNNPAVYLYQFRINHKYFGSNGWKPHRDFDFWHGMDGMPDPEQAIIFHFLISKSKHTIKNGGVMICENTHKRLLTPDDLIITESQNWQAGFNNDLKYTLKEDIINNIKTSLLSGEQGACLAMHPLLWHFSLPNHSHENRTLLSVIFNTVDNAPLQNIHPKRPEWITSSPEQFQW